MRKQRRTNENTSMSEEAKVGLVDEAIAIASCGQKIESKEEEGSVEISELDRNNSNVELDSSEVFSPP